MAHVPVQPVILCGGCGTRLWPLSRSEFPKQFLRIFDKQSLFQQALRRVTTPLFSQPLIVSNEDHRFLVLDQLHESGVTKATLLLEPLGRNTAPALAFAACVARARDADPVLIVTPADQVIMDNVAFAQAIDSAVALAAEGAVVLLGIKPTRPETGYGYMRTDGATGAARMAEFVEKPDAVTAERYMKDGRYFWNSGIFVLRASVWQKALAQFRPDIAAAVRSAWEGRSEDGAFTRPDKDAFAAIPAESIDYAVMEKAVGAYDMRMVPLDAGWSDLGSWDAAWQAGKKDASGNTTEGDVLLRDCRNVLVQATSRLVSVVGLENVVVVETPDALLVTDRTRAQEVKTIVAELRSSNRIEPTQHRKVYRPWGWYDSVDEGERFKVKRIMVKPGASLSLQKHSKRAEHWVVVSGVAEVVCGERTLRLQENESTYIPLGEVHRLSNPGMTPLEIIEVQSGSYLGEDDIVRLEDHYGR